MKKLFALLLALAMMFSLVACGEKEPEIDISGKYTATSCTIDGEEYPCDGEYVQLNADGTGTVVFMDEEYDITWTLSGDSFSFKDSDGDKFDGTYADGVLEGDYAGCDYVYDMNAGSSKKASAGKAGKGEAEEVEEPVDEPEEEPEEKAEEPKEEPSSKKGGFEVVEGELGDYYVSIVGLEEFTDSDDEPALRIYYDFTNNSDERAYAGGELDILVKQSGFELTNTYASYDEYAPEYGNDWNYVLPGVTVRCVEEVKYQPEAGGTIVVTFEEWWSEDTLTLEIDADDLPGAPADEWELEPITEPFYTEGWDDEGEYNECEFKILSVEKVDASKYSDFDECVRVYFEFTNNTDEATSCWWKSNFYVYQDGMELDTCSPKSDVDEDEMYDEDIEPGETVTCSECWGLRSDSPIEVTLVDTWEESYIGAAFELE